MYSDMANLHGKVQDYRASASVDLEHDEESWEREVQCPLLTLWGPKGPGRLYDVLGIWKERGVSRDGPGLRAGHNLPGGCAGPGADGTEGVSLTVRARWRLGPEVVGSQRQEGLNYGSSPSVA